MCNLITHFLLEMSKEALLKLELMKNILKSNLAQNLDKLLYLQMMEDIIKLFLISKLVEKELCLIERSILK
jgi:hypothetical protein